MEKYEEKIIQTDNEKSLQKYGEFDLSVINDMVAQYQTLTVSEGDDEAFATARKALTTCVRTRTAIDKRRKALGADLRQQLADINDTGKLLTDAINPAESHLKTEVYRERDRLKKIEDDEKQFIKDRTQARVEELSGYLPYTPLPPYEEIEEWDDEAFGKHADAAKLVFDLEQERIEAERLAEQERQTKVDAEQKAEAERLETERKAFEETQRIEQIERDRIFAEQQAAIDKANAELAEKQALNDAREVEIQAAENAKDEKARIEQEEVERVHRAAEEAERAEKLKPDKTKAIEWVKSIRDSLPNMPIVKDSDLRYLAVNTLDQIKALLDVLHEDIEEL